MTTTTITRTVRSRKVNDDADGDMFAGENGSFVAALTTNDSSSSMAPEVISDRIAEAQIPDWVYRRFPSSQWVDVTPAVRIRRGPSRGKAMRVFPVPVGEPAVSDLVHIALARSGYPLQHVRCWCDDQTLTLSGFVTRYYYVQVAVEAAMALANGRRIGVSIDVVPSPLPNLSAV